MPESAARIQSEDPLNGSNSRSTTRFLAAGNHLGYGAIRKGYSKYLL